MKHNKTTVLSKAKIAVMMVIDAILANAAYYLAFMTRFLQTNGFESGANYLFPNLFRLMPFYAVAVVLIFCAFRLYNRLWEYSGVRDITSIFAASLCASCAMVAGALISTHRLPLSIYFIGAVIQLMLIAFSRFAYKVYLMERNRRIFSKSGVQKFVVVGKGSFGRFAINQVAAENKADVVAMMDVTSKNSNRLMNGIPLISSIEQLEAIIDKKKVTHLVIADAHLSSEHETEVFRVCESKNVEVQNLIEYLQNNNDSESAIAVPDSTGARVIPFSPPDITDKEIDEVKRAMKSGWITTGPRTKELEKRLAAYCGTSKAVCLNSATAAEELNFRICGIGEGDEVIVPAYTYTATASAAIHCGAKVIFIDSAKDSTEMDYEKMAEAITEKTKAIVAVDLGGIIADYDKIFEIVNQKKSLFKAKEGDDLGARIQRAIGRVLVFADCAHALGASKNGVKAGAIADFTDFSFHAVKNFTTAEGGASTWRDIDGIDNEEMYKKYQLYSLHGQSKDALAKTKIGAWEYDIIGPWYKCNMTDIMAAIGLRQLDRYPEMLEKRKNIIAKYDAMCDSLGVKHLVHYTDDSISSGHLYITRIPGIDDKTRREIIIKLAERGVNTNVHYKPLPMMTAYKELGWDIKNFPNAYAYYENLITLPLHTLLTDQDIEYIVKNYTEVVKEYV